MRKVLLVLLGFVPAALSAQEGRISFSRAVQFDFEVPERFRAMSDQIPTQRVTELVLLFNSSESVMRSVAQPEPEGPRPMTRAQGAIARLRMGSGSRRDRETLIQSHVRFADGAMAERREFMGRAFLISGARPNYSWSLGSEQRQLLGYVVQKATTEHEGSSIEAWFTMEIPVPAGPGEFGGLPGMILLVSVDAGRTLYAATEVDLSGLGGATISPPEGGEEVTRDEYERIVAEKLEEIQALRRDRARRRPPR